MKFEKQILGIDIGSVSVHAVITDHQGNIVFHDSRFHHGEIRQTLTEMLRDCDFKRISHVAAVGDTPSFIKYTQCYDDQVSMIRAAQVFHSQFDAILHVGGEKFSLSRFDDALNYLGAYHNTSCAAGTGSFLDQQARRLKLLGGAKELSIHALGNQDKIPQIATRCAVFAKTDLIHAQQEGYRIDQICDGLCLGLAKNLSNTLFKNKQIGSKIIFCGGVSHNQSVTRHLESITGHRFVCDKYADVYGAAGAAFCMMDRLGKNRGVDRIFLQSPQDLFIAERKTKHLSYPPLSLQQSDYPDFSRVDSQVENGVEADIYQDLSALSSVNGFLGLDVGSTSTKSILIDSDSRPVAGFYTKTASRPVEAVQKIFKAYDQLFAKHHLSVTIQGCGTTGSGRRISAKIIGADIEPDEITAHAAAAVYIEPKVDTIIEIGGQDAKFTLLSNGIVTSSIMNTVCAAGTGSFIEEQALKLGCPLSEYSDRAENISAPMASDRCTVFMERDINYYFAQGHSKDEVLASVLHSVRDNYLTKVANIANIGNCIMFQGATAKNKALVAAFEQKLEKPIHVSKYCHLTGALGVALMARQEKISSSRFKGFALYRETIPVRQEVCSLCQNNCKLTIAQMAGETLAYGFLCGRDYDTNKRVPNQKAHDLLKLRRRCLPVTQKPDRDHQVTIGLPKALHLYDDFYLWEHFFAMLGMPTVSSDRVKHPTKLGKTVSTAEFCAPLTALHGHVKYLQDKTDFIFLPFYFEDKQKKKEFRRQYCYYSQFAPSVITTIRGIKSDKILSPTIKYLYTSFHTKLELYKALKPISPKISFFAISSAWDSAVEHKRRITRTLIDRYRQLSRQTSKLNVVLLGRPYTVLSRHMNNHVPTIFENLGVLTFFQDMLDMSDMDFSPIEPLLKEMHWKYAAVILKAAFVAANTPNLYPVLVTSFRCAPDSFAVDYFKQIMERHRKPYLVLELDEHDSSVGYETRVEAAVRAFENHKKKSDTIPRPGMNELHPRFAKKISNKTVIFPNWDTFAGRLIVSIFRKEGYNAFLMEETPQTLKKSILTNTGQCIPLNAVAAGFISTVENLGLDPDQCVLWLNPSEIACNIKLYPYHIKQILIRHGHGFEQSEIYKGELSLFDLSFAASTDAYFAYMFGGLLRSIGCKIRPYEIHKGETDRKLDQALEILCHAFEHALSKEDALQEAMNLFKSIETRDEKRPQIGIFGDLYVRDNDVMNQDLIHFIEDQGGEVITTPYYKYIKIIANSYFKKWFKEGKYLSLISNSALLFAMQAMEKKYYKYFEPILDSSQFDVKSVKEDVLYEYGLRQEHTGESMDNVLKIHHLVNEYPDLKLLVQTNPAFCCPGLVTEAMAQKLEERTGVPIVSITYDVSGGNKNRVIIPFLKNRPKTDYCHSLKVSV